MSTKTDEDKYRDRYFTVFLIVVGAVAIFFFALYFYTNGFGEPRKLENTVKPGHTYAVLFVIESSPNVLWDDEKNVSRAVLQDVNSKKITLVHSTSGKVNIDSHCFKVGDYYDCIKLNTGHGNVTKLVISQNDKFVITKDTTKKQ